MIKRLLVALATVLLLPFAASASPITYIYSGVGDGSFNGTAFDDASFTITATADTANIGVWSSADLQNTHSSATVTISGFAGTFSFSDPTHTWIAESCCMGFGQNLGKNLLTFFDPAIASVGYGLATALGPVTDLTAGTQGQFVNEATSGGALTITSVNEATFQAVAVPEPSTYALMALGLAGVAFAARRRPAAPTAMSS
jgi:PEP-CTERM motif